MLVQDAGSLMQILEMVVSYTEGSSSQETEMKNLWVKLATSKRALVKKDKSLKLSEEESGRLFEECMVLLLEKNDLEG